MPKRTYPVEVLWCGNVHGKKNNGWSFPAAVRNRLLEDFAGKRVLHLFGGMATFGTKLDIDPTTRPHVLGDAWLPPFKAGSFDVVVLDPPYFHINADVKVALFRAANFVAVEHVVWFHTIWASSCAGLSPDRAWLVRVGDTCACRCLQYFRVTGRPGPVKFFPRGPAMKYNRWLAQPGALPFSGANYADPS